MQREDIYLDITINKPIHGTYCSIDYRKLQEAVRDHKDLRITITGLGTGIIDPRVWYETRKDDVTKDMKYKGNPMRFIYNYVNIPSIYKQPIPDRVKQLQLF